MMPATPFTPAELSELDSLLAGSDGGSQVDVDFRRRFPGRSVTRCDLSDLESEVPYRHYAAFDLFFLDGRDHCWRITADPACATGIVLARRRRQPQEAGSAHA